jgi:peptidoglycan/xylan/chitin deacetylase (PgdA/CDA1 family)
MTRISIKKTVWALQTKIRHRRISTSDPLPKIVVLLYHRILGNSSYNPLDTVVPLKVFEKQISQITKNYPVISLSDAVRQLRAGLEPKDKIQVVLSFDDGYADNYFHAFNLLKEKALPAVFFVPSEYVGKGVPLWDWYLCKLFSVPRGLNAATISNKTFSRSPFESRIRFTYRVMDELKGSRDEEIWRFLRSLKVHPALGEFDACLNRQQLREMASEGMEIGSHSAFHSSLARLPLEEARDLIVRSKREIESLSGKPCLHFSFPFGSRDDYNENLIALVKEAGFLTCMLNIHGFNHLSNELFCYKRIIMTETTDIKYLLG